MKLHLPKQLFTALLAAITLVAPAAVTLGTAAWANSGLHNNANYLLGGTGAGSTVQGAYTGLQETTLDGKVTTLVTELNAESLATFNLWADDSRNAWTNALVGALRVQNGATIKVSESQWKHENGTVVRYFDELHIENLHVAGGGAAVLNVSLASHNVVVDGVTGVLRSVTNAGSLTLGEIGSSVTLGGNITNSGTLTLRGDIYGTSTITGGTVNLVDFSNVGNLTFGAVQVSGVLGMNGSGNVTWESLELAEGTILEYGKGANTLNIGTIDKSVTLYLYEVEESLRSENGVKLGISLGEDQTLEDIRDYLRVDGLASDASFALKEVDGAVYISSTGALDSGWDNHWGASGLANRPTTSISIADPTALSSETNGSETFYMVDNTFSAGEVVSVELTGEGDYSGNAVIVGGFATTHDSNGQGSVERDVWIKASSGQYKGIVGGNVADNWGGTTPAAHFTGDTHIVVDGATVGAIIGGTYRDSKTAISPIFTGDTYISVLSGDVKDFIFGAAANTHNSTTTFNGNTNIYVYVPLVNNATGATLGDRGAINAIVGGAGKVANDADAAKSYINGNTNVTIDLSGYNGALTTFAKQIVGGSKNIQNSYFSQITGNTYVNILGKDGITFTKEVIGGSAFDTAGTATINGSTNVHISGGSFSGLVIGGNYSTLGGTMRVGNVNMGIGGDVNNNIIGANYVSSNTATISARDIAITVGENGASIWNLVGGHYVDGTGGANLSGSLGDVTITLAGGTIKDTYGGSWILRNKADATITQGDIHIDLQSGNLNGDIYAAGRQAGSSKMTTASTKVSIGSDVSITIPGSGNRIISGGYRFENDNSGSTVTEGRTLVFNGESQDRSAITFDGFDIIQVTQKNAVVTLGNLTNFESLTKTGAGTLTMSGANTYTGGTVVSEGKLVIGSAGAVGSGAVTVNAGATLEVGTMPTDWTAANMLAGKVTGTGTLLVSAQNLVTGASAYATTFGGTLELANDVMFTFGGDTAGGNRDHLDVNTKSITGFILNSGSTLQYQGTGANAQFNNLQVKAGTSAAVFKLIDTGNDEEYTVKLTGVTQLDNELKLQANWGGRLSIEQLSGAGTLTSSGGTNEDFRTTINSLEGFTGKLSFTDDSKHVVLVKTGTETPVKFTSLDAVGSSDGSFAFEVGAATEVNTVNIASGSVTIAADASLSLLGDAQKVSAIGTLGGAGDFVNVDGRSTIETLSGFSGDLSVQGGALVVNTYNAIETMAVTVNNGASLSIGTVNVNAANHGLTAEGSVTYVYSDGSNDRNGYLKSFGTYVLFDGYVWEGSVGGIATEVDRDANKTYLTLSTEDRTRFYVNEGTENYDTTDSSLHISSDNTAGIILNGGNLNVLTSLNQNATGGITVQSNATITLATDAQLNEGALSVVEGKVVTLSGSGTYALLDGKISRGSTNIALATDGSWSGITKISNVAHNSSTVSENSLATMLDTAGSGKLMLTNVNGWLGDGDNTGSKTLILENGSNGEAGLYLSNGSSNGTATFNGGVEGSGDIRFSWTGGAADSESKYEFTGSTSQWYGKFIADSHNGTKDVKVSFTKDGSVFSDTEIGGGVENQSTRKLTVEIGSTSGDIDFYGTIGKTESATGSVDLKITNNQVALHRNVTATNLTVDGGATAVVNATLTAADTVQLGDAATIRAKQDSAISMTKVQMSSTGISGTATDGARGSISNANVQINQLAKDASFTIQDMTLTNTTITAATTKVSLNNVSVAAGSAVTLAEGAFAMQSQATVGTGGDESDFTTSSYSGFTLGTADSKASITLNLGDLSQVTAMGPGVYDITILLDGFQMVDGNASVLFASDSWLGKLLAQSNNANVEISISQVAAGEAAVASGGASTGVSYSTGSVGTIITINGLNVPEPTTSTLSLLALAGLCARRRRKM